jgi:hypothetical protein
MDYGEELRNRIPKSKMMELRLHSAMADIDLILKYIKIGAFDDEDIGSIDEWAENLVVSLNEMRMNFEVSAAARTIPDKDYMEMMDAFMESEEDD